MKKLLAILLAAAMLLSLCACGNKEAQLTEPTGDSQSTTGGETTTENTTGSDEGTTENVTEAPTTGATEVPTQAPTQAPAPCSHNWKAATCTAAKTCTKCGVTEGSAAGHSWAAATCTAPKTCKTCKATEGSAAGHSWAAATCTAPKTCKTCKATEGSAAGHSWAAATCTAPKTCTTCKVTEGAAGAHTFADGVCSTCGAEDRVNPKEKLVMGEEYIGHFVFNEENHNALASVIGFREDGSLLLNWFLTENPEGKITLNGKTYKSGGMGGGAVPYWFEVTDSEIIITNQIHEENSGVPCLKAIMLSSGHLKVTYSTLEAFPEIPVGTILYAGREAAVESVK